MVNANEKMLEEARIRFPIGCKFKPVLNGNSHKVSNDIITQNKLCYLYECGKKEIWIMGSANIYNPITGTWADLIDSGVPIYELW